jgi:hypothetical protein
VQTQSPSQQLSRLQLAVALLLLPPLAPGAAVLAHCAAPRCGHRRAAVRPGVVLPRRCVRLRACVPSHGLLRVRGAPLQGARPPMPFSLAPVVWLPLRVPLFGRGLQRIALHHRDL